MRPALDRRAVLKLGLATAWTVPVMTSTGVAAAVGSPAPSGGGVLQSMRILTAGSTTIRWRDAAGDPAGPVPRQVAPAGFARPKPFDARAVLSADPGGTLPAAWPGTCSTTLYTGLLYPNLTGPTDVTPGHWYTAGAVLFSWYVYPSPADAVEQVFTWPDVWLVFLP